MKNYRNGVRPAITLGLVTSVFRGSQRPRNWLPCCDGEETRLQTGKNPVLSRHVGKQVTGQCASDHIGPAHYRGDN